MLVLVAACSAADVPGQSAATRSPHRSPTAASTAARATDIPRSPNEIQIGDHYIDPVVLTVKVGATVTWRNSSGQHDVRARDGSFSSPTLGESYSHTFRQPGRYLYYCSFHQAEMRGEIIVVPAN